MTKKSGVYFISDDNEIRIGESKDLDERIKQHNSSRSKTEILAILPCEPHGTKLEEEEAQEYFRQYHIRGSFYSIEIKDMISDYINKRTLDRMDIKKKEIKRKGTVNTLWGPESITEWLPNCSVYPHKFAGYMDEPSSKTGFRPRQVTVLGEVMYLSEKAKRLYQNIVKDTKIKLANGELQNEYIRDELGATGTGPRRSNKRI